jgi:hypothetical protein
VVGSERRALGEGDREGDGEEKWERREKERSETKRRCAVIVHE